MDAMKSVFERMHAQSRREPETSYAVRRRRLAALEALLCENVEALAAAISTDFGGRSTHETRLLEVFPGREGLAHAQRHLRGWMRTQGRSVSLWFQPGRAEVRYQPLGVVGIIVPWNYPLYLTIGPLTAALAAGNRALVKMSEFTPVTATLLAELIARYFDPDEVAIVQGEAEVAQAFSQLPFDHLFFTGSTAVGHHVMRAAAANLTPVTLELGGKSPAIIAPAYPLDKAADRILVGKCLNAGQTCIAPDYVLLPEGQEQAFIAAARTVVAGCYPQMTTTPDYSAIVNARHYERLVSYLDDAVVKGATVVPLSNASADASRRHFPPVALLGARDDMRVMQEEIFGPILPILPYRDIDAAIAHVNQRPRPLALYVFDEMPERVDRVLAQTVAGGVTVNDTILHIAQDSLPFGGVGPSGMGCYHGREGFLTFSHAKAVFRQSRLSGIGLFKPPYGKRFEWLIGWLLR
ncbi:MAG: coniferyl aldehyde dehydrogenase [Rhodocyclaceae bacterium]